MVCACLAALAGCATLHREVPPVVPATPWDQRLAELQNENAWQLDGRAAVALGQQGWQASLDWRQSGAESEVHLAGPLGVGALLIKMTPAGLSLNGAPPSNAVVAQLQARLGFELPLDNLRYWLLGVPDPSVPFELVRNAQDRVQHLSQAGWGIEYDKYLPNGGDVLPGRLVLSRGDARVRIAVDRWETPK
jgi:outer membrane lipoprotein LolB